MKTTTKESLKCFFEELKFWFLLCVCNAIMVGVGVATCLYIVRG